MHSNSNICPIYLIVLFTLLLSFIASHLSANEGEEKTPIPISTIEELQAIGNKPEYPLDGSYVLTQNIDASATKGWNNGKGFDPIGCELDNPFTGILDGQGYVINDIFMSDGCCIGLFEKVANGGEVRNLWLEGGSITGSLNIGPIASILDDAKVTNCYTSVTIIGSSLLGGIVGKTINASHVINCAATGDVFGGQFGSQVGGLIGMHDGEEVFMCYASGNVSGQDEVGGLIGINHSSVTQCFSTGGVKGKGNTGGLIGISRGRVVNCYATGSVTGYSAIGGLFGGSTILSAFACYSTGKVSATEDLLVGGLMGWHNSAYDDTTMLNYSFRNLYTAPCFWDMETSGQDKSERGTGLETAKMKMQETFESEGWDFQTVWGIHEGQSYPYLLWQPKETITVSEESNQGNQPSATFKPENESGNTTEPEQKSDTERVAKEFELNYHAWKAEIRDSLRSAPKWFISRKNFRNIVALGPAAIPYLKEKLEEDQKYELGDYLLAFAVVEIYEWNPFDFYEKGRLIRRQGIIDSDFIMLNEEEKKEFRDNVLKRLNEEEI